MPLLLRSPRSVYSDRKRAAGSTKPEKGHWRQASDFPTCCPPPSWGRIGGALARCLANPRPISTPVCTRRKGDHAWSWSPPWSPRAGRHQHQPHNHAETQSLPHGRPGVPRVRALRPRQKPSTRTAVVCVPRSLPLSLWMLHNEGAEVAGGGFDPRSCAPPQRAGRVQ